jgi:hypothetical protein
MTTATRSLVWIVQRFVVAILVLAVAAFLVHALQSFTLLPSDRLDTVAYWNAGRRIAGGESLYPALADPKAVDAYRYAPWFAMLWAPLTALSRDLVFAGWTFIVAAASVASLVPLLRLGFTGWCLAALMLPFFGEGVRSGNVQALVVAGLVYSLPHRRLGPVAVALAASLKVTPLAFALVYLGRRDWRSLIIAVGGALLLWAPAPFLGLLDYPTSAVGTTLSMFAVSPLLWAGLLVVAAASTLRLASGRYAWIAAATTMLVAFPYPQWHYPSILVAGIASPGAGAGEVKARHGKQDQPLAPVLGQRDRDAEWHQPGAI